jgi:DNA-binding MarR family transcriptional regulator
LEAGWLWFADLSCKRTGFIVTGNFLREAYGMSTGRASALIDQLEAAGAITKKDENGRRRVV